MLEADSKFGKFEFRPLEPGFGITVGNALRRILLSSLEGFAINTIKIEGVEHEFATVPGVKEDVTNIILNLKQVRFKQVVEEFENEKVSITVENSSEFMEPLSGRPCSRRGSCGCSSPGRRRWNGEYSGRSAAGGCWVHQSSAKISGESSTAKYS